MYLTTVKPRNNGTKSNCLLLPKSAIASIKSKRIKCQKTEAKFAIKRFSITAGALLRGSSVFPICHPTWVTMPRLPCLIWTFPLPLAGKSRNEEEEVGSGRGRNRFGGAYGVSASTPTSHLSVMNSVSFYSWSLWLSSLQIGSGDLSSFRFTSSMIKTMVSWRWNKSPITAVDNQCIEIIWI